MSWVLPLLWASIGAADAAEWEALRVLVACESGGRVGACTLIRAFVNGSEVLKPVPRSNAEVVVYVSTTSVADTDRVLLRFTSELEEGPGSWEQLAEVDSRETVDEQRAQLEPALMLGLTPFLLVRLPEALQISLASPDAEEAEAGQSSPWGVEADLGGWGNWTRDFQSLDVSGGARVYIVDLKTRAMVNTWASRSVQRQPSLQVGDSEVSLDSESWSASGFAFLARNLDDHWSIGVVTRGGAQDPEALFERTWRGHVGVEHNWFAVDDPRGNNLAAAYLIGVQADAYNTRNVLGETAAVFPTHLALLEGDIRKDRWSFGVDLAARAQVDDPLQRYVLSASVDGGVGLGAHLDFNGGVGITQQAIPGPAALDQSDFETVTQSSYAEPLGMWGNLWVTVHFRPTNGVLNNRFGTAGWLGNLSNL